jgi:hypothetical protein
MTRASKIIHFPTTRLTELVSRGGGITRELAVEEAKKSVEDLRDLALETIEQAIGAIEAIAYSAKRNRMDKVDMKEVLIKADHLVTITATFGLRALEDVLKSLCDVTDGLLALSSNDAAPIVVHVQAMRLLAPDSPPLDTEQSKRVLAELSKVREHFHFAPLTISGQSNCGPPEIAS